MCLCNCCTFTVHRWRNVWKPHDFNGFMACHSLPTQDWCLRLWLPALPHLSLLPRCRTTSWRRASTLWVPCRLPQRPCLPQPLLLQSPQAAHLRPLVALMHQVSRSRCTFFFGCCLFVSILEVLFIITLNNIGLTDCRALSSCGWASSTQT